MKYGKSKSVKKPAASKKKQAKKPVAPRVDTKDRVFYAVQQELSRVKADLVELERENNQLEATMDLYRSELQWRPPDARQQVRAVIEKFDQQSNKTDLIVKQYGERILERIAALNDAISIPHKRKTTAKQTV